ncbi:MAG: efflux RND transporter permease subunit [Planctomycetes bacterium]|nr:efflux RND transporter permease subunit [Planctomycetota bacterium]
MKITEFSLNHRIAVFFIMFAVALGGVISYATLPRESAPDVKVPLITVAVPWSEASPVDIESSVTIPLEREIENLKGVKQVNSTSSEGVSITLIEFTPDVDVEQALQRVREKVDIAKTEFPDDVEDETVTELSFSEFPIMTITLSGADIPVLQKVAESIEDKVEQIPGVLDASIAGGIEEQIEIELDPEKLEAYKLPVDAIISRLRGENVDISAGGIDTGSLKPTVRLPGEFKTPEDVASLIVYEVDGVPIYMRDVATAKLSFKDATSYARRDGKPSVTISISKRAGANIIHIAKMIRYGLNKEKHLFPSGVEYDILVDESEAIEIMVADLENNILSGLILVLLVILLALGTRNAFFVALAIPFSMGLSFIVLQSLGVTLNMVVLFGLILANGMLVDNAIVIIENIYRHMGLGKSPFKAALEATSEVAWPVIAATATTVGAFGPMIFWPGMMGEFMRYIPITVIVTLISSLFVALVISPVIAATFMRVTGAKPTIVQSKFGGFGKRFLDMYERTLRIALRYPKTLLGLSLLSLIVTGGIYSLFDKGSEMFPEVEPKLAFIKIKTPEGTSLQRTDAIAKVVESRLPERRDLLKGIETTIGGIGAGDPMSGGADATHIARVTLSFKDFAERVGSPTDYLDEVRELISDIPGAEFEVQEMAMGPPTSAPINIEVAVDDETKLVETAKKIRRMVESVEGCIDVRDNITTGKPELRIKLNRQRAALLGLNTQWTGNYVKMLIGGRRIGGYDTGNDENDIIVRLPQDRRGDPVLLDEIRISTSDGRSVPLSTIATWEYVGGSGTIKRKNSRQILTVSANLVDGVMAEDIIKIIETKIEADRSSMPAGFRADFTGEQEDKKEAMAFLSKAFMIALVIISLILVLQFNSIAQSSIILGSVLLSLIGVIVSLIILQQPFGIIMTGVAIVALAGVVVNNAIVMIDYTNYLKKQGQPLFEAVVQAGRTRLRPVLLTAITTTLSLAPMAMQVNVDFRSLLVGDFGKFGIVVGGEGSAMWAPLATAVMFGLMIATVLTLVVVPAAYVLTAQWGDKAGEIYNRLLGRIDEPQKTSDELGD